MLDTPSFGGGNTTLDALAVGLPIVTLEGPLMKQKLTGGMLHRIGLTETITTSAEEYIHKAIELGTQRDIQNDLRQKIFNHHAPLYNNTEAIHALDDFLKKVLNL
jgi:predicted O-linked N-acetylglucosamine transferase (SPINDLY family)